MYWWRTWMMTKWSMRSLGRWIWKFVYLFSLQHLAMGPPTGAILYEISHWEWFLPTFSSTCVRAVNCIMMWVIPSRSTCIDIKRVVSIWYWWWILKILSWRTSPMISLILSWACHTRHFKSQEIAFSITWGEKNKQGITWWNLSWFWWYYCGPRIEQPSTILAQRGFEGQHYERRHCCVCYRALLEDSIFQQCRLAMMSAEQKKMQFELCIGGLCDLDIVW